MTQEEMKIKFDEWCNLFCKAKKEEMDESLTKAFLALCFFENMRKDPPPEIQESFLYQIAEKRSEFIGLKMGKVAIAFLSALCGTPGEIVMYLYYLKSIYIEREISMHELAKVFPYGFPTREEIEKLWDAQKVPELDNLLDHITF